MSADPSGPHGLPCLAETSNSGDSSPVPAVHGPEESYSCLQMSAAEVLLKETASPRPSSLDLPLQDSPDSSTSPTPKLPGPESEANAKKGEKVQAKKQKMRTVFSQAQLSALKDRFQRQRYLSLQQMQELSAILNLSYKQVKTWFQNQRMKCKRWQRNQWLRTSSSVTQGSASVEYPDLLSSYPQGYLVNTSGSLSTWGSQSWTTSVWNNQTWTNPAWSNQSWTNPTWSNQSWTNPAWSNQSWTNSTWSNQACTTQTRCTQAWNNQAWNASVHNFGEDSLQPYVQFQQNFSASDLEASLSLEATGESHTYVSTPQVLELLLNYSVNMPGDM